MNEFSPPQINRKTYAWSVKAFSTVKRMLGVNIKLHADANQVEDGHIFLFNHFARFETFIPQYLIYQDQKAYCRSVASHEFFTGDERFTNYLHAVGAVSNTTPGLLALLARDILKGRKIIIFPEGGMVKDKKIRSEDGDYSIYSPTAQKRRKHHSGAARLALILDLYKKMVLHAHEAKDTETLRFCCDDLGIKSIETLVRRCQKPTKIIPSNITFYPIRISENFLKESVERFTGDLPRKFAEELLIEGNIILKDTDMDIRMGEPLETDVLWNWWEKLLIQKFIQAPKTIEDFFEAGDVPEKLINRLLDHRATAKTEKLRDQAMQAMYQTVTINLSHLASRYILKLLEERRSEINCHDFLKTLYLAARYINHEDDVYLHRSLLNSNTYRDLRAGNSPQVLQFLTSAQRADLIEFDDKKIIFKEKLKQEHGFHQIRMENPICVYANECEVIDGVENALTRALDNQENLEGKEWAQYFHEDELHAFEQAKTEFDKPEYKEINDRQTATENAQPFFFEGTKDNAILLVHGFLASPAEMRELGLRLNKQGYTVYGVRLEGHGTSPCDLQNQSWKKWMESVERGYEILSAISNEITIVGFSTGGALATVFAAERPEKLRGLCAVSTPYKFANPNLVFVPLIHHANRFAKWIAAQEGLLPYIRNESEHPDINYADIPVRALHELRLLVDVMDKNLQRINCPTLLIQGNKEKVVKPESANLMRDKMVSTTPKVIMVNSERHGIITENIDGTCNHIESFIQNLDR